jgi:hypothetical protein
VWGGDAGGAIVLGAYSSLNYGRQAEPRRSREGLRACARCDRVGDLAACWRRTAKRPANGTSRTSAPTAYCMGRAVLIEEQQRFRQPAWVRCSII